MLPKHHSEGFLYFDNKQPQRLGGYHNQYETFTSNNIVCNIDSIRTDFTNSSGKKSSVWLWKGNYNMIFNSGWHIGAEIGAYDSHGNADDTLLSSVTFDLKNKTSGSIVSRTVSGQYWINRFDKGISTPSDLILTGNLTFKNESDAEAYCTAVKTGLLTEKSQNTYFNSVKRETDSVKINATRNGNTVTVTFE